jgi:hypothetical protein
VAAPIYAPALVGFYGGFGVHVGVVPVGWVALGWGEPLCPWWGHHGFIGRPWWGGWGGPRVVNNVVINKTTVVNVNDIHYRNAQVRSAVVAVRGDRFGREPVQSARLASVNERELQPIHGALSVKPTTASLAPATASGLRPSRDVLDRSVVATRAPHDASTWLRDQGIKPSSIGPAAPAHIINVPRQPHAVFSAPRAPFGQANAPERPRPALPPRFQERSGSGAPETRPYGAEAPQREAPRELGPRPPEAPAPPQAPAVREAPPVAPPHVEAPAVRQLPGEPANRLFPGRSQIERQAPAQNVPHPSGPAPGSQRRAAPAGRARHR